VEIFEIQEEISGTSVADAINALNNAYDQEEIKILLPYNSGGSVPAASALIRSIMNTKASVVLQIDRYAISAAAFIWVWFFLKPERNVVVQTTKHRPRLEINDHLMFLDDIPASNDLRLLLEDSTKAFDELFESLLAAAGYISDNENIYTHSTVDIKHKFKHARDGYYLNQDFVIPAQVP